MPLLTAAILLAAASVASAGTTDDSIPDAVYVEYGKTFAPYTRRCDVVEATGGLAIGTCVIFAPRLAMTAAHVVSTARAVSVDGNAVTTVFVHPKFDDDEIGFYDVAILRCQDDFGLAYYPPLAADKDNDGTLCTLAGYGVTGRISGGYTRSDGLLRAGTQRILRRERTLIVCDIKRGSSPREFGIAPGDSGGPLFVGAGADARLAGIHSFTMRSGKGPLRSREGEESAHTDLTMVTDWVEQVMGMVR